MKNIDKTREQLLKELVKSNKRIVELEKSETERKQAEEALKRSETQLKEAQKIAKIGSWEMDIITKKIVWSEQMHDLLEVSTDQEPTFELYYSRVHPNDLAYAQEVGARVYENNEAARAEYRLLTTSGTIKYVATEGRQILDEKNNVIKLTGIVQNITKRKQAEDELKKKMNQLEIFNEAAVGRELRMIELKKEINELLKKAGEPEKYL